MKDTGFLCKIFDVLEVFLILNDTIEFNSSSQADQVRKKIDASLCVKEQNITKEQDLKINAIYTTLKSNHWKERYIIE